MYLAEESKKRKVSSFTHTFLTGDGVFLETTSLPSHGRSLTSQTTGNPGCIPLPLASDGSVSASLPEAPAFAADVALAGCNGDPLLFSLLPVISKSISPISFFYSALEFHITSCPFTLLLISHVVFSYLDYC